MNLEHERWQKLKNFFLGLFNFFVSNILSECHFVAIVGFVKFEICVYLVPNPDACLLCSLYPGAFLLFYQTIYIFSPRCIG